jgi:hypothetical protein
MGLNRPRSEGRYCRQQHSEQDHAPHRLPPCLTITICTDCGVRL